MMPYRTVGNATNYARTNITRPRTQAVILANANRDGTSGYR